MARKDKQTALQDAARALETAEKRASSTLRQKEVAVEQHEKRLQKLQEQLKEKKEEIDKMTIKAPCPGIVIYGDPNEWWDREEIRVGGEIWGNNTILTIPDLRVMQIKLQVHEADISKVDKDQVATVTMDTYPGLVLTGKVTKVASIAGSSSPWQGDDVVKKFDIKITLDPVTDVALKPGISAKAEIFIEKKESVLSIPLQCVFIEEGVQHCYVMAEGQPERRAIKSGSSNDSYAEVLEGLEEGELVLLYNPNLPTGVSEDTESEEGGSMTEDAATAAAAG
jgi:HlyD family secretion protein